MTERSNAITCVSLPIAGDVQAMSNPFPISGSYIACVIFARPRCTGMTAATWALGDVIDSTSPCGTHVTCPHISGEIDPVHLHMTGDPRSQRVCTVCHSGQPRDEQHRASECPAIVEFRESLSESLSQGQIPANRTGKCLCFISMKANRKGFMQ